MDASLEDALASLEQEFGFAPPKPTYQQPKAAASRFQPAQQYQAPATQRPAPATVTVEQHEAQIATWKNRVGALENEKKDLQQQVNNVEQTVAAQQLKLRKFVEAIKEERALNEKNVNVLQDQIEEDQARILGLEDKVRKLVEMVKSERRLREELASQQSPVSSAQTNANALALKQAQKEVEELQNQAITMEGIITEFKEQQVVLENQATTLQSQVESLQIEVATQQFQLSEKDKALAASEEKAVVFESKLSKIMKVLRDARDERNQWLTREQELSAEVENLRSQNEVLARGGPGAQEALQREVAGLRAEVDRLRAANVAAAATTKGDSAELERRISELQKSSEQNAARALRFEKQAEELELRLSALSLAGGSTTLAAPPPPPVMGPPGGGPPPPPPPPAFKKLSGKLNITKSEKPPQAAGEGGDKNNLTTKLMEEISRGVTLRKAARPEKALPQQQSTSPSLFSLGTMASELAKKRQARVAQRSDSRKSLKLDKLDSLLKEFE